MPRSFRLPLAAVLTGAVLLATSAATPQSTTSTKLLALTGAAAELGALGWWAWPRRRARRALGGALAGLALLAAAWPRDDDPAHLQAEVARLGRSFEGTRYVWGGETREGIDCSGLIRQAVVRALLRTGHLARAAEWWWFDSSAKALGEGFRGWTRPTLEAAHLRTVDLTRLEPGDLAVTADGAHVLLYLGEGTWAQADPVRGAVMLDPVATSTSGWFTAPVRVMRVPELDASTGRLP